MGAEVAASEAGAMAALEVAASEVLAPPTSAVLGALIWAASEELTSLVDTPVEAATTAITGGMAMQGIPIMTMTLAFMTWTGMTSLAEGTGTWSTMRSTITERIVTPPITPHTEGPRHMLGRTSQRSCGLGRGHSLSARPWGRR
jgi:hypothetical protein